MKRYRERNERKEWRFFLGVKGEQSKIYTFEYGVNIISGEDWRGLGARDSIRPLRHSHQDQVIHPK